MCGIWALINKNTINDIDIEKYFKDFMKIKNRGPDFSNFLNLDNVLIGFHRLSIMNPTIISNQPYILSENNKTIIFICNGEIYNYKELINEYDLSINTKSDCLTIPKLYLKMEYEKFIELFYNKIKGEFAFILFDYNNNNKLNHIITVPFFYNIISYLYHIYI